MIKVLGLSGSLRKASYNTATLLAASELAPSGMSIEIHGALNLPLYDEDLRANGFPPEVELFRQRVAAADAILFSTPEYNHSMPAVLKNAIDWGSRRPDQPFKDKPAAIMGASTGLFGTTRAQSHLRLTCGCLDLHVLNKPEVLIASAAAKFDAHGRLVDEQTRMFIRTMLENFADWIEFINRRYPCQ